MENTLANKAKFFALYWGQEIQTYKLSRYTTKTNRPVDGSKFGYITLKNLSSISDEDAIEVAKIRWGNDVEIYQIDKFSEGVKYIFRQPYKPFNQTQGIFPRRMYNDECDFLRSRGYALPWMGLSVEELVNRRWVKLKGENK